MTEERCAVATIPSGQKFSYRITPNGSGLMNAEMIGKQITAIARFMRAAAEEDGVRMAVVLTGAKRDEADASLIFDFAVLPYKDKTLSRNKPKLRSDELPIQPTT